MCRLGAGAFADGYGIKIEKDDPNVYAVLKAGGYMYRETAVTDAYPKPTSKCPQKCDGALSLQVCMDACTRRPMDDDILELASKHPLRCHGVAYFRFA